MSFVDEEDRDAEVIYVRQGERRSSIVAPPPASAPPEMDYSSASNESHDVYIEPYKVSAQAMLKDEASLSPPTRNDEYQDGYDHNDFGGSSSGSSVTDSQLELLNAMKAQLQTLETEEDPKRRRDEAQKLELSARKLRKENIETCAACSTICSTFYMVLNDLCCCKATNKASLAIVVLLSLLVGGAAGAVTVLYGIVLPGCSSPGKQVATAVEMTPSASPSTDAPSTSVAPSTNQGSSSNAPTIDPTGLQTKPPTTVPTTLRPTPVLNDNCNGATPLGYTQLTSFSPNALFGTVVEGSTATANDDVSCNGVAAKGVWFNLGETKNSMVADACSLPGVSLSLYTGLSCASASCDESFFGNGASCRISFNLLQTPFGEDNFILVHGGGGTDPSPVNYILNVTYVAIG